MSWQPLKDVMDEIKTRQKDLDHYVDMKYRYSIYEPGTTFLRYSITNFKLQLYNSLREKYKNLNEFLPFYNMYFLVEDLESSDSLKIFSTRDQVNVAKHRLREQPTWFFKKKFESGLASDVFKRATNDEKFTYASEPNTWYENRTAYKYYTDLDRELKIFGIEEKKPSYMYIYALKHIELLLVLTDEDPQYFEQTCLDLIKATYGTFIKKLNKKWDRMIYDQNCWYDIWVDEKERTINEPAFKSINRLVKERINMYINDKNLTTDEFINVEEKSKKEFKILVNELKKIDSYCIGMFGKPGYPMPYTHHDANFYEFPILVTNRERNIEKFRDICVELYRDYSTDVPEVASHNLIRSANMEKIALSWCNAMNDANLHDYFPNLLKAIWLHYIGLTKYASTQKNLRFDEVSKYRAALFYLGADGLTELKSQFYLTDDEISILKTMVMYHSRIAPLTGKSEEIECNGIIKIDPLEGEIGRLPTYPYFLMVILLRLMDSIDVQWNRCGQYRINHSKKRLEEAQTPLEEPFHFFKHAYFDVVLNSPRKEVVYVPDLHSPICLILYAFAEVISEIEKELKKVNQEGVIEKVRKEWKKLTKKPADGDLEIGFLKLREGKFDVDVSLEGMLIDFSKEAWREPGDMPEKLTVSFVCDETDDEPVGEFDVFIAYNSEDVEEVLALSKKIKKDGITLWYDKENIYAGDIFPEEMEAAISKAKCGMIIVGKKGLGKWQEKEYDLLYKRHVDEGITIIPVLLPGCSKNKMSFLDLHDHVSFNNNIDENKAYDKLIKSIRKGI